MYITIYMFSFCEKHDIMSIGLSNIFEVWSCQRVSQSLTILVQKLHDCFGYLRRTTKHWPCCLSQFCFCEDEASSCGSSGFFILTPCSLDTKLGTTWWSSWFYCTGITSFLSSWFWSTASRLLFQMIHLHCTEVFSYGSRLFLNNHIRIGRYIQ